MSLQAFIEQENRKATFFKTPLIDINSITAAQAQEMFQRLDSNLSPESLFADGERPKAQAMRLMKVYEQAFKELRAKGFVPEGQMYNM